MKKFLAVMVGLVVSIGTTAGCGGDGGLQLPQGEFLLGAEIPSLPGLVLPYRMTVDGGRVELQAIAGGELSEVLTSVSGVTREEDNTFVLDLGTFTQPGQFVPTGSDVDIRIVLNGEVRGGEFMCGTLEGEVINLGITLENGGFGVKPWTTIDDIPISNCDGIMLDVPRLETCPAVVAGRNMNFPSGFTPREFEVLLPSTYDSAQAYPIVFTFHGLGRSIPHTLDLGFRDRPDIDDVIVVAPQALGDQPTWNSVADATVNADTALFDDMLKCIGESFNVDSDRVYVSGMSAGGLMAGALVAQRSDIVAAAAPFSGGILTTYVGTTNQPPVLVTYGGSTDIDFGQNFETLSLNMVTTLRAEGHFTVLCNHDMGHVLDAGFVPWAMQFLLDHTLGSAAAYTGTLPPAFPGYCSIAP